MALGQDLNILNPLYNHTDGDLSQTLNCIAIELNMFFSIEKFIIQ